MIVVNEIGIYSLEGVAEFISEFRENAYKQEYLDFTDIYEKYLIECFHADQKLQEMVIKKLSDDYISFVILPLGDTQDLNSFEFQLASQNGDKIKKRQELIYYDLCNICFGGIQSLYSRLVEYYEKP